MSDAVAEKHLGFGLVGRPRPVPGELAEVGAHLLRLGYRELWANDGRDRSGLATVATAGGDAPGLDLGVGVMPLSERTPAQIADEVRSLAVSAERLIVGVGTGDTSSLAAVRDGVLALRSRLPGVRLAVGALGPRMCRLAGEVADVVLLNWASPDRIAWSRERVAEGARSAGRDMPRMAGYVRVAIGPGAGDRLVAEADRYRRRPRPYVRLFAEQGALDAEPPGVAAEDPAAVAELLAPYRAALDSCVVRALPAGDSLAALIAVADAAAG